MRSARLLLCIAVVLLATARVRPAPADDRHHIIFDTDFALPPQDDGLALALALNSPELDIVGITTVSGNYNVARANADVLRMLEIANREDVKVYGGASRPLAHVKDTFATTHYGKWWSDDPPPAPPGGFAKKTLEPAGAVDFMIRTVMARPGEIEILAIGPLTNIANALQKEPGFARAVKRLIIMGGAIAALPNGAGNITPNAEYNFWVDPEAARIALRSGIPIMLSPLNVSMRTSFDKASFQALAASVTPITKMIDGQMRQRYEASANFHPHMYDEVAVASVVDPTLVKTRRMIVDVDATHGLNYGVSVGGTEAWPGAEGARMMDVQYDIDNARFMKLFVERLSKR